MLKNKKDKITYHVNIDRVIAERFEKIYPRCRSRLITNLLRLVCDDEDLFDRIFFCDLLRKNE